tara:strand:- start:290 stop:562 length:273 start_codon:yes stop_codon:yes gene_type:complete
MIKCPQFDEYVTEDGEVDTEAFWSALRDWENMRAEHEYKKEMMNEFDISEKDWEASSENIKTGLIQTWKNWSEAEDQLEQARNWMEESPI